MAKATKAATPKAYMLTEAQLELLTKAHSLLDTASDTLNGIDGDEETVKDHLDKCPGYVDLTNEEKYGIMEETKGENV